MSVAVIRYFWYEVSWQLLTIEEYRIPITLHCDGVAAQDKEVWRT